MSDATIDSWFLDAALNHVLHFAGTRIATFDSNNEPASHPTSYMVNASAVLNALELFYLFETSNSSPYFGVMTSNNLVNLDDKIASSLESMPRHCGKHVGNAVSILFSVLDVEIETAVKSLSSATNNLLTCYAQMWMPKKNWLNRTSSANRPHS